MPSASTPYVFRVAAPDTLVRAALGRVRLEAELDGSPAAPSSATCELWSPLGGLVATATVAIESGVAVATFAALDLPSSLPYSADYSLRWGMAFGSDPVVEVRRQCALAPYELRCPVTVGDMLAQYPGVDVEFGRGASALAGFLDEAWTERVEALFAEEILPSRVVTTSGLRKCVLSLALFYTFRALAWRVEGPSRWSRLYDLHLEESRTTWPPRVAVDRDDDGVAETGRADLASRTVYPNVRGDARIRRDNRY
jgi:hypothetical protein